MKLKGKKRFLKRAVVFARALGVFEFKLTVTNSPEPSFCQKHVDGSFTINVSSVCESKYEETVHLAHEMVHLRQYKHDQLIGECDEGITIWEGENYLPVEYMSDDYFLSPWEMEARALEDWLVHKWESRKRELH